jgi:hypothetical protein
MKQFIVAFDRKTLALSYIYAEQINDSVFNIDHADKVPDYLLPILIKTRVMSEIGLSGLNPNTFSGITVLELKEFIKLSNINLLESNKHTIALIEITTN